MQGNQLPQGEILDLYANEDKYWMLFNRVFSDATSKKRSTYKFGMIKAILDNLFNVVEAGGLVHLNFYDVFAKFTENYWNLVVKYGIKQMKPDGKSEYSKVEQILKQAANENLVLSNIEFEAIDAVRKEKIIKDVTKECKRYVLGALYADFEGLIYGFHKKNESIWISYNAYEFMLKFKSELENLNYYAWAKFLEKVNDDNALIRVIDKLELSTPKRNDLSVYRKILYHEFQEQTCFYCGKKLTGVIHVDHFIPWSFVKDDKIWNFVLACPKCNEKKSNKIPTYRHLITVEERNKKIQLSNDPVVKKDFDVYSERMMKRIWKYARESGLKEM